MQHVTGPIRSLTGIRGIAALWVALFHATLVFHLPSTKWTTFVEHGWSGVDLFFVLSGFILMHAHGEDFRQINRAALKRFFRGRVVRIYPLNLAVLLGVVALVALGQDIGTTPNADHFVASLVATASLVTVWLPADLTLNQPVWSLSAEMVGYAVFPALACCLMRLRWSSALVAVTSLLTMVLLRISLQQTHSNQIETVGALVRLAGCFVGGAALWRLRQVLPERWSRFASPITTLTAASILACSASYILLEALPSLFGILIIALSFQRGWIADALSRKGPFLLGVVSFPFYLTHLLVMHCVATSFPTNDLPTKLCLIAASLTVTLVLAALLHLGVELPGQRLGRPRRLELAR